MEAVVGKLGQNWWLLLLEGIISVLLGVYALTRPGITLVALIVVWGLFALVNGVIQVVRSFGDAHDGHSAWGWQLAAGLVGIVAGLVILRWPGISALFVLFLVGIWAIVTGIVSIVHAIADHEAMPHAWLVALGGVVSVLFGIVMFAWPGVGLLTLVYLVGIYAIVFGVIACITAFRLHSLEGKATTTLVPPGAAHSY
jgi:uncharacterized membrane protein HdeD (DUF308 family)